MQSNESLSRRKLLQGSVVALAGVAAAMTSATSVADSNSNDLGLFGAINRVKDPAAPSGLEKKHAPVITAPATATLGTRVSVRVQVGSSEHPMTDAHWIERLRLFTAAGQPLADLSFARTGVAPVVTIELPLQEATTLVAQAVCNLHGIWESRHHISV